MRNTCRVLVLAATVLLSMLAYSLCSGARVNAADAKVYVIDVHGTVWPGQASFVKEKLDDAAKDGASAVILDVDTFGGLADAATDIKDAVISHDKDFVTVGYVHDRALSSGSLITLSCKYIAMAPAATLGSAQPHPDATGGDPGPELLSWARKEFSGTAEFRGRNPAIAEAWVTASSPLPALGVKEGDILTMTTDQAKANGYCDIVASGYPDILSFLKLSSATVVPEHLDFWQAAAEWISDPWITALILGLGLAAVIVEMLTLHSWGIAGLIGGVAVAVVFIAHILTGTATIIGILIFLAGIALLLFETHVLPGHGLSAIAGLGCIFFGLFLAIGGGSAGSLLPFCTSILVTIGSLIAFFAYLPKSRLWRLVGQNMQQRPAMGYVSSADYTDLIGRRGVTSTMLRPSGAAEIDGMRFTVVSEGSFLQPGAPVEVVLVQGSRIVVREISEAPPANS
jgi:membrane-bound serine protease (ClpP class)